MMRHPIAMILFTVLPLILVSGSAPAAGFDCAKAATAVEQMVCGDPALSRLDEVLADAYRRAGSASVDTEALKMQQREWLRARRDACTDATCLTQAYRKRIGQLHGLGGFTAANGMSEMALAGFLQRELNPDTGDPLLFVPVRSATETAAQTIVFFAGRRSRGGVQRGSVDVSQTQPRVILIEDY